SIVCNGSSSQNRIEQGVRVRRVAIDRVQHYSAAHLSLDVMLTRSQALYEGVRDIDRQSAIDIIDVPLWGLQGFVTVERERHRALVWLQTTYLQMLRIEQREPDVADRARLSLERRTIARAAGVLADSQSVLEQTAADFGLDLPR